MKILLSHRYFWPDAAPYGLILKMIGTGLAEVGHQVEVFSTMPSYRRRPDVARTHRRETIDGLTVRRISMLPEPGRLVLFRAVNVVFYCLALFVHVLRRRPDVVTASTFPPVLAAFSASLGARLVGARFVYHVQDIHPEVSRVSGGWLGRGWPERILRWLDDQTLRRSDAIVTLSPDMRDTLLARQIGPLPIRLIANPSLDDGVREQAPPHLLIKPDGVRRLIFAGNLGRFQNLTMLAEGVALLFPDNPDLELLFLGDGVMKANLQARWGSHRQVRFGDFLPFPQAKGLIRDADIGLVSLAPGIHRVASPSKVQTYLGMGLSVLALVEPDSHLARDLEKTGRGRAPKAATPEAIADALHDLLMTPPTSLRSDRPVSAGLTEAWQELIASLETSPGTGGAG